MFDYQRWQCDKPSGIKLIWRLNTRIIPLNNFVSGLLTYSHSMYVYIYVYIYVYMYICIYVGGAVGQLFFMDDFFMYVIYKPIIRHAFSTLQAPLFPHFKPQFSTLQAPVFHTSSLNFPHFKPQFSTLQASIFHTSSPNIPHFKPQFSTLQASIFHTSSPNIPHSHKPQFSHTSKGQFSTLQAAIFHTHTSPNFPTLQRDNFPHFKGNLFLQFNRLFCLGLPKLSSAEYSHN